jgi:hypothetical protein
MACLPDAAALFMLELAHVLPEHPRRPLRRRRVPGPEGEAMKTTHHMHTGALLLALFVPPAPLAAQSEAQPVTVSTGEAGLVPVRDVLPLPYLVSAFFLVYIAVLLALRTFDLEDRALFRSLIPVRTR